MPQNIIDALTFTTPVVAPADSDVATAGSVLVGLQALANRTGYLNSILNSTGATVLRSGPAATMTALTGMAAGSVFLVTGGSAFQGLYVFTSPSALVVDNKFVYAASGGGQWVHHLYSLLDTNLGLAAIGPVSGSSGVATSRIQASVVPNRFESDAIVQTSTAWGTAIAWSPTTSFSDIASAVATLAPGTAVANDIVQLDVVGYVNTGASPTQVQAVFIDGGTTTPCPECMFQTPAAGSQLLFTFTTRKVVVNGGNCGFKLQMLNSMSAGGPVAPLSMRVTRYRP